MDLDSATRRLAELFGRPAVPSMPAAGTPLAVYGAGNCGRDVLRVLREGGYEVAPFLDANAAKIGFVDGIPCHEPGSAAAAELARSGMPVLIAVFNFTADTGAIEEALHGAGFATVLPYYALDAAFPGRLKSRFWLATRGFWEQHRQDVQRGLELWDDDRSRGIYLELVELRLTGNLQLLRRPDREHQYFPQDLPPVREPARFVDGGAFVGDTLAAMTGVRMEAVAAFEPDPGNFRALSHWVEKECPGVNVRLFQSGLGAARATRRFRQGDAAGSAISESGESTIKIVALDEVLPGFAPTFIKLDIEGAEIDALNGAAATIGNYQPRVAACVYHLPEHLWEVPLLLRKLLPSHSLHLRYHGYNGFDAVAYAIEP